MFEVDPETYRYFFSASAQVFAAIFAVVAIAYGYRLMDLQRKYDEIQKEKVGKAFTYKDSDLINGNYVREFIGGSGSIQSLRDNILNLDIGTIEAILKAIIKSCDSLLTGNNGKPIGRQGITPKEIEKTREQVEKTLKRSDEIAKLQKSAKSSVILPVVFSAMMTIYSLFMLSIQNFVFKVCLSGLIISSALLVFSLSLLFITLKFIKLFSDK